MASKNIGAYEIIGPYENLGAYKNIDAHTNIGAWKKLGVRGILASANVGAGKSRLKNCLTVRLGRICSS